ncbi:MAG: glycosyl hydrolase, partial [Planctomycetaceae bacterium]
MFMPIPNRYYERVRGWAPSSLQTIADTHLFAPITANVRQVDQFGGYTAGAGHALYTARTFPQPWWNRTAFVCGPTGHLIGTFVLRRDGADYASTSPINLLASDDEWCAPIMAEVGPDGAVWVIDWYNYIVQHNPTPQGFETGKGNAYESDLRDKQHGRFYRVVPTTDDGDTLHDYQSLADASNAELVEVLTHPSFRWRLHAQRLLIERNAVDMAARLIALLNDLTIDGAGLNVGAIHALHTLDGLGLIGSCNDCFSAVADALDHPSVAVRRNAVHVLPANDAGLRVILGHNTLFTDADIQVQLHAIIRLADMSTSAAAASLIVKRAQSVNDRILLDGLTAAGAAHALPYLMAVAKYESVSEANRQIARRVAEHVARGRPATDKLRSIIGSLIGTPAPLRDAILEGLTNGLPARFLIKENQDFVDTLITVFTKADATAQSKLIRLAAQCGSDALDVHADEFVKLLLAVVSDTTALEEDRVRAARDLVGLRPGSAGLVSKIVEQLGAQTTPSLGGRLLQAVEQSQSAEVGGAIVEVLPALTPQLRSAAVNTLLSRSDWAATWLKGVEDGMLDLSDLSLEQKQSLQAFPDEVIRQRAMQVLSMSGGLPDADRERVLQSLLYLAEESGDVEAGIEMYKKHCSNCHQHGELGKTIGPHLTGMAVHPKEE